MRILLTNNTLGERAGTELYLHDVALELMRRGHQPIAFSTVHGQVAGELRAATIPVIDNLDKCGQPPDIIHGQHHYETLTASLYFPETPVVNFCHGWAPALEEPLLSPRVLRYIAVDDTCRDRLIDMFGIAPERVTVLLNFVDTALFRPRAPLPSRPLTALAFGNYFAASRQLAVIREACAEAGIVLDVVGLQSGHAISHPQDVLPGYDLVFAKARAAIEAMAIGTAVILAGPRGMGPMVDSYNWERLRRLNFGVRSLNLPVRNEIVLEQIGRYNPAEVSRVSQMVRSRASLDEAVDRLIEVYEQVIAEWKSESSIPVTAERAAARHLNRYASTFKAFRLVKTSPKSVAESRTLELLRWVVGRAGWANAQPNGLLQGYIETAARFYGVMKVSGWATHRVSKEPCLAVVVMQGGICVAAGFPEIDRPDVSEYLGEAGSSLGFELQFDANDGGPVRILALLRSGEILDMTDFAEPGARLVLDGLRPREEAVSVGSPLVLQQDSY